MVSRGTAVRSRSDCRFSFAPDALSGVSSTGESRGAFRSGEARPLAVDWPLRVGHQSWFNLEALTSDHKLPRRPMTPEDSRGFGSPRPASSPFGGRHVTTIDHRPATAA